MHSHIHGKWGSVHSHASPRHINHQPTELVQTSKFNFILVPHQKKNAVAEPKASRLADLRDNQAVQNFQYLAQVEKKNCFRTQRDFPLALVHTT